MANPYPKISGSAELCIPSPPEGEGRVRGLGEMKVTVDFFRAEIMANLQTVGKYHLAMEQQLDLLRQTKEEFLLADCKTSGASFEEYRAEKDSLDWTFTNVFPRSLRYSFVMFLFSIVENQLVVLCEELRRRKNLAEENMTGRMSPLERCKAFLSNTCAIDFGAVRAWERLAILEKVRNCIAHAGGRVEDSRDKECLEKLATDGVGISISGHPTSKGLLAIEPRFCKDSTDAAIEFFTAVFERGGFGPATARVVQ